MKRVESVRNSRYSHLGTLERTAERTVERAKDTWDGNRVIRKTAAPASSLREAKILLALPEGIAPRLLGLERTPSGLTLVLEEMRGETLSPDHPIPRDDVPNLVLALCSALAQVHRIGWVHADLKPSHILRTPEGGIRLLDFGFAIDLFEDASEQEVGGTPPYLAPELWKGWLFDSRADQYSLGVLLSEISPGLKDDARWGPILKRLTDEFPARRYPDVVALRKAVSRTFGIRPGPERFPRFGAGPMRGRDTVLASIVRRIRRSPASRLLIQTRPRTGLTRFLLEVVRACAASGGGSMTATDRGRTIRMIDLGAACSRRTASRVRAYLESPDHRGETIILGIGDPSPGLLWGPGYIRAMIGDIVRREGWERFVLPPIDLESMREIVATSLGSQDPGSDEFARLLWEETEGDMRAAEGGFRSFVERSRKEAGLNWTEPPKPRRWDRPAPLSPSIPDRVAPDLAPGITVIARAGSSFPERLGARLLAEFCPGVTLDALRSHGYLDRAGPGRLRFVTRRFWRDAFSRPPERSKEIDHRVCETDPDLDDLDQVFHACTLARRIGERWKAGSWLGKALCRADGRRGFIEVVRILSFPAPAPPRWTAPPAMRRIARLRALLGPTWTEERLCKIAGRSLKACGQSVGTELLKRAAAGRDPSIALDALLSLADDAVKKPKEPEYARYRDSILSLASNHREARGAVCFFDARAAYFGEGRIPEAMALAQEASVLLKGTGSRWESLNSQLLAAMESSRDPRKAIGLLRHALSVTEDPETRGFIYHNASIVLGRAGRLREAGDMVAQAIHELSGHVSSPRILRLRAQRAWYRADCDEIDPARKEGYALLGLAMVRLAPVRRAQVESLLAFCEMHRGNVRRAGRHIVRALSVCDATTPTIRLDCLSYLADAVLDFEAWELLDECGGLLHKLPEGQDAVSRSCGARINALLRQAKGEISVARGILEEGLPTARTITSPIMRLRYLHHLGSLRAAEADRVGGTDLRRGAVELLEEVSRDMPKRGNGYYRIRALLSLGSVLMHEDRKRALSMFTKAVSIARGIRSASLLAISLESRMRAQGHDADHRGTVRGGGLVHQ